MDVNNTGYVYLMKVGGFYKIGHTKDYGKRVASLEGSSPFPPELLFAYLVCNPIELERELHDYFSYQCFHSEWFLLDKADRILIKERLKLEHDNPITNGYEAKKHLHWDKKVREQIEAENLLAFKEEISGDPARRLQGHS